MTPIDAVALAFLLVGALFFLAGTVGLLRLPDVHSRLHALAKADNTGLGLVAMGLAVRAEHPAVAVKLLLIWGAAMLAGTVGAQLVAQAARSRASGGRG